MLVHWAGCSPGFEYLCHKDFGRCVWEKGFKEITERACLLSDDVHGQIRFLVLGDGPHLSQIQEYARRMGVFHCFLFPAHTFQVEEYMSALDLFLLPSYRGGLTVALLEAMALGSPCIATQIRGCREITQGGHTGLLIPPKSSAHPANAISALWKNPHQRMRVGDLAAENAIRNYREQHLITRTMGILENLLCNHQLLTKQKTCETPHYLRGEEYASYPDLQGTMPVEPG